MDPASSLPIPEQPQGSSTYTFFQNARDFSIHKAIFNNSNSERIPVLDGLLKPYISEAAMHDSLARYPPPKCHPKTREKVLKIISDWIDDSYPGQRIMWLNGPAGAGKSAIAQTIAERYKDKRLAASFFFLRNTPDRGGAGRLFPTLAWQLAMAIPETRSYFESALEAEPLLYAKSINIQFNQLIGKVFEHLLRDKPALRPDRSLVIIDGVDECVTEQDQKLFLTLIADALAHTSIPLWFLICSRPEVHIKETFNVQNMKKVSRAVVLDEKFAPSNDIRRYLEDTLSHIFIKRGVSPLPSDSDIQHLTSKASGQFIYASTVIKFIDDDDCNPTEHLDIILKLRPVNLPSPYAQLDQLYMQILSQHPDVRLLRDVFVLIIALSKPRFEFICRRLRRSEEDLRRKLRRMHSLLQISDIGITTYHCSLHDFFQDKGRAGKYHVHPMRVALVRLPKKTRPFIGRLVSFILSALLSALLSVFICLLLTRILMSPLFVIPGLLYSVLYQDNPWFDIIFFFPISYDMIVGGIMAAGWVSIDLPS